MSAVDLARKILHDNGFDLLKIAQISPSALMQNFVGVGPAKAAGIAACFEVGRRVKKPPVSALKKISSGKDAFAFFAEDMCNTSYECFQMLLLNLSNNVLRKVMVSEGGLNGTTADPKKIFKIAIDERASAIIFAHNHPSGMLLPSELDISTNEKLVQAAKMFDIKILDHLIIGGDDYFSFAESGLM
jgi:DNA repair protein RadC